MLRAVLTITRRGNLSLLPLSSKGLAPNNLRQATLVYSQSIMRYSNDNKIKGTVADNPGDFIDNFGSSKGMASSEPTACAQAPTAAMSSSESDFGKQTEKKHFQPDEDDFVAKPKARSMKAEGLSKESAGKPETGSKLSEDTMKQLQAVAANLPSKEQVEKFAFRVLAFIYDIIYLTGNWTIRFINEQILQNNTFKYYWKRFHEKMQAAKKD